jgi:dTDP-4-amino-4,6-dideoxygalactose transaminase
MKIPFFNYSKLYLNYKNNFDKIFYNISSKGSFIMQQDLEIFEKNLSKFHGIDHCIGVNNATDAMQLLLVADNIGAGDEIIFCSHTMTATASAIKFTGAKPIAVNCNEEYLMDYKDIKSKINSRTRGIFVTQLNGRIADMNEICEIAKKNNLKIYEDAAQAIGSKYSGKSAGSFGVGGCISFYPAKILGCFGDGGAVITNYKKIYNKIMLLRDHGRKNLEVKYWGYNSRLDNIQAGFLNFLLTKIKKNIEHRRKIAKIYFNELSINPYIKCPPNNLIEKNRFDNYQNFEIQCKNREKLRKYLSFKKIGTILPWGGKAVHEFKNLGCYSKNLKYTESIMRKSMLLPMSQLLSLKEALIVAKTINSYYKI